MPCQSARSAETPHTAQYMSQTCCVEQRHHMSLEALGLESLTSGACAFLFANRRALVPSGPRCGRL
eukprot:3932178-Rhodomonas_salina.2